MTPLIHWIKQQIQKKKNKKTTIGKARKGFDFLGKRVLSIGALPSASALSRMQRNTERPLFGQKREQGATKQRIVQYWMKWLIAMGSMYCVGAIGAPCISASGNTDGCGCDGSGGAVSHSRTWNLRLTGGGNTLGARTADNDLNVGYCTGPDDIDCSASAPTNLSVGTHYFRNTSEPYEYYTGTVTHGANGACDLNLHTPSGLDPEIDIQRPANTSISDDGSDAVGTATTGSQVTLTYIIANTGTKVLNVSNIESANPTNVTVGSISSTPITISGSGTSTFNVSYTPTTDGAFTFDLDITSNDPDTDKANYDIRVSGTAVTTVPDNHPTNFTATANSSTEIATTWTDSTGTNLPDNYLVLCGTSNSFINPVDGTAQTNDTNCSDGSGIQNVSHGTQTATWSGLTASTQYFFKIFPSAGSGAAIKYKTDETPATAEATTSGSGGGGGDGGDDDGSDDPADEPDDQPTGGNANGNSDNNSIEIIWTDTSESPNYAVFCNTTGNFTDPVDGVPQTVDTNCGDGSGVQTVVQNTASTPTSATEKRIEATQENSLASTWSGLESDTTYFFKIYPYNGSGATVNYKTDGDPLTVNATTDGTSDPSNPGVFGGEKVTPTVYKVTVSKVEFKNAQGQYVTLAEDGTSYDVASVSANSPVGTFGKTAALPNGSYSEIRVTLAGSFEVTASGSDKGSSCRTDSSGSTGSVSSTLTNVSIGVSDGGTATPQVISYPSGSTATSALSNAGISQSGNNLLITAPASFTITDGSFPPNISLTVDVANAIEVLTASGNCNVLPQPPSVNVFVGG